MTKNEERLSKLFKELVPDMGKAESLAGELVRAINRIGYRFCNDGDMVNIAYGKETCNPPARFLIAKGNHEIADLTVALWGIFSEDAYEKVLDTLEGRLPTTSSRTQTSETSRPKTCGTSRMRKKTRTTAGWMRKRMTGTKRTKITKPEKHTGLAGNGGPFSLP